MHIWHICNLSVLAVAVAISCTEKPWKLHHFDVHFQSYHLVIGRIINLVFLINSAIIILSFISHIVHVLKENFSTVINHGVQPSGIISWMAEAFFISFLFHLSVRILLKHLQWHSLLYNPEIVISLVAVQIFLQIIGYCYSSHFIKINITVVCMITNSTVWDCIV